MTDLNQSIASIERPDRIKRLKISPKGFPVPWFVAWVDGVPDFRCIAPGKVAQAYNKRLCWICGEPLGRYLAFVIGPMCTINRVSSEPASHLDCAKFAAQACPFLTKPNARRNEKDLPPDRQDVGGIPIMHNPGVALVYVTLGYRAIPDHGRGTLFELGLPLSAKFFCEGRDATREEVLASIHKGLPYLQDVAETEGREAVADLQKRYKDALELVPS